MIAKPFAINLITIALNQMLREKDATIRPPGYLAVS